MSPKYNIVKPDTDINKILYEFTTILNRGWVEVGEEGTVMPLAFKDIAEDIENFQVNDTDIFVMSYPKTGTTWTQEMVWMTYHYDFERGKQDLEKRFPFLEFQGIQYYSGEEFKTKYPDRELPEYITDTVNYARNLKDTPRFIKTHLPWSLLPRDITENRKQPKIIYVCRNPKDTCTSFYHHCRLLEGFRGTEDEYYKLFLSGRLLFGSYWKNVLGYWSNRDKPNLLIIKYEDMKRDLSSVVRKVAAFLGKERTEEEIAKLVDHLSFESMKKNSSINTEAEEKMLREIHQNGTEDVHFFRKGIVGSYRSEMPSEIMKQIDEQTEKFFKGTGLVFDYCL